MWYLYYNRLVSISRADFFASFKVYSPYIMNDFITLLDPHIYASVKKCDWFVKLMAIIFEN